MTTQLSTLTNGLRVSTDRVDTVDTVSLGIWIDVGTRHEPAEINGVAHFLEHMAFKGTERRSALAIAEEIEAVGGHLNAYTSRESTAYYAKVLKEDLPLALDILSDILQYSTFDCEEIERERAVILQEIGQANDTPDDIIFDYFQERAFPGRRSKTRTTTPLPCYRRRSEAACLPAYSRRSERSGGWFMRSTLLSTAIATVGSSESTPAPARPRRPSWYRRCASRRFGSRRGWGP